MEQIQQRKMIWSQAKPQEDNEAGASEPASNADIDARSSAWTSRLAAATTDTTQINKFQRLLGIKKTTSASDANESGSDLKIDEQRVKAEQARQKELLEGLDKQYSVARAFTHTGRGRGLGFE